MDTIIDENWEIQNEVVDDWGIVYCDIMTQDGRMVSQELMHAVAEHIVEIHQQFLSDRDLYKDAGIWKEKEISEEYWCDNSKKDFDDRLDIL